MLRVLQLFCCCCSFFFENFHWNEFRKVWWEDRLEIKLGLREGEEQAEPQGVTSLGGDEPKGLPTPLCGGSQVNLALPSPIRRDQPSLWGQSIRKLPAPRLCRLLPHTEQPPRCPPPRVQTPFSASLSQTFKPLPRGALTLSRGVLVETYLCQKPSYSKHKICSCSSWGTKDRKERIV